MTDINLDDIKIENENEFIELNEEKPINKPVKRKYKKREIKDKNTENEIKNTENNNKNTENIKSNTKNHMEIEYEKLKNEMETNKFENILNEISKDDIIYKGQLIEKINKYKNIFYEYLIGINFEKLETKNTIELELILKQVKNNVQNRNMENNVKNLIQFLPVAIEKSGEYIGLQLDGYSGLINSQKDYYYTCQEILIENNFYDKLTVSPSQRLLYILGSSALLVHTTNSQINEKINENMNKNINPDNFNDL